MSSHTTITAGGRTQFEQVVFGLEVLHAERAARYLAKMSQH